METLIFYNNGLELNSSLEPLLAIFYNSKFSVMLTLLLTFFGGLVASASLINPKYKDILLKFTMFIVMSVSFLSTLMLSDEVFINLEHVYNFYNHGYFSMKVDSMVDGTVELFYYMLLYPFSNDLLGLALACVALGLLITYLHGIIFFKLAKILTNEKIAWLVTFSLFLFPTFVTILSNGFGNSLVSLFVLISLYNYIKHSNPIYLLIFSFLPLLRPDAIILSVFVIGYLCYLNKYRNAIFLLLVAAISMLTYYAIYKLAFGHFIPTPVEFKSFSFEIIKQIGITKLIASVYSSFSRFFSDILVVITISFWILSLIYSTKESVDKRLSIIKAMSIWTFLFGLFYIVVGARHISYDARYFVTFFPLSLLVVSHFLFKNCICELKLIPVTSLVRKFGLMVIITLTMISSNFYSRLINENSIGANNETVRVEGLTVGAELSDILVDKSWSIATTEMNSFGYMIPNRNVEDLWGYTNPLISKSDVYSKNARKINLDILSNTKPSVIWLRTTKSGTGMTADNSNEEFLDSEYIKNFPNYYQLGSHEYLISNYSAFVLLSGSVVKYKSYLLINNDIKSEFISKLKINNFTNLTE